MVDFKKKLEEMRELNSMNSEERKDHTPLMFGKYKHKKPIEVADIDPKYIVWMYEEVKNKVTCSHVLYRECGGRRGLNITAPSTQTIRAEPKNNTKLSSYFDDYDDDIPF